MTNFTLRPAWESEFCIIKDLIHSVGINPMGLDWSRFTVAVNEQQQVLGIGQIKSHGSDVFELASIAVFPEYRNQGVARAIIKYLLTDSPRPLYLTCISSLEPLYQKFDFRTIAYDEMPRYFQRISKLANLVFKFANPNDRLLVMKLQ